MRKTVKGIVWIIQMSVCLIAIIFTSNLLYAQASLKGGTLNGNKLYYSAQTGQKSTLSGSLTITKSDSLYEHGSAHLNKTGPVIISPTDFSMGIGKPMKEIFTGAVTVDPSLAPPPGHALPASISGDYDIFYSCPMDLPCKPAGASFTGGSWQCEVGYGPPPGHCHAGHGPPGGPHSMVEQKGTDGPVALTVYSLFDSIAGPACVAAGDTVTYSAIGYPAGGTYIWSNGKKTHSITIVINKPQTISVTYTIAGVSYNAKLDIKLCCKCNDIYLKYQPPAILLGLNKPLVSIYDSSNIPVPANGSAIFYVTGCDQVSPTWSVDYPGYIVANPAPKDSVILLSLSNQLAKTYPGSPQPVVVKSTAPGLVKICATFQLDTGPCKKCATINFGPISNPGNPNPRDTLLGK